MERVVCGVSEMTRREAVLAMLMAGAGTSVSGCGWFYSRAKLHYRMTVEVDTPQGIRTGSSIIESTIQSGPKTGEGGGIRYDLRGTATIVDLSAGKRVFALLVGADGDRDYHAHLFHAALERGLIPSPRMPRKFAASEWNEEREAARRIKPTIVLTPDLYPKLVWFPVPDDIRSVSAIRPEDFENIFGTEFSLRRIFLSVTDEDLPKKRDARIPSFGDQADFSKWRDSIPYGDPRLISYPDFYIGEEDGSAS